jgi:hypothetical protein
LGGSGLVAIALLVLAYAAVSRRLLGSVITPAMVFVAGGILASTDVLGWLRPDDRERIRPLGSRGDADGRSLLGRVADRPRSTAPPVRPAASPARDRVAADDRGRRSRGCRRVRTARVHRGRAACDRARPDGRCARAGGRYRLPDPVARPPGSQCREWAQRRHLRPTAPDRDRDRRGARGCDRTRRCGAPRARGDRLRNRWRRACGARSSGRGQGRSPAPTRRSER